jgi:hypothetical protein
MVPDRDEYIIEHLIRDILIFGEDLMALIGFEGGIVSLGEGGEERKLAEHGDDLFPT